MKKYQRLILTIATIASVTLFLVYREQYNRLRHVLEVFNFFGTPCNVTALERSDGLLLEHDWGAQPLWQQLDDKAFLYSAFSVKKNEVEGLGAWHSSVLVPKNCFLFFEDGQRPVKAKAKFSKLLSDAASGFVAYKYYCNVGLTTTKGGKVPYAIGFKSFSQIDYVAVLVSDLSDKRIVRFNSTVCVDAASSASKKSLLEFLAFHNLLGVESFVVYYRQNVPHKLVKFLLNFSNSLNVWLTFYPFNAPLQIPKHLSDAILEQDCRLRTAAQSKYSIVLDTNEYVVPFLDDVNKLNTRVPVKRFCLHHNNNKRPMVLQNFEAIDDGYNFNEVKRLNSNNASLIVGLRKVSAIFDNSCLIHRYEKCDMTNVKTKTDSIMKKFSTDLTRHSLVQLLMHESV